jgi:uncharacterized membrane protein
MAGIGFALRQLTRSQSFSVNVGGYAYAIVVAAGPWLFTCVVLAALEYFGGRMLATDAQRQVTILIVYNFALSLVVAGPLVTVVGRVLADGIHAKDVRDAPGMLLGALAVVIFLQALVGVVLYGLVVELQPVQRVLALTNLMLLGGIWLASAYMAALKSYGTISGAFAVGLLLSLVSGLWLAERLGATGLLAGFTLGLVVILFTLLARVFAEFPYPVRRPLAFLSGFRRYPALAAFGLLYNAAIWVDKVILWFGPGHAQTAGLNSHPAYDSGMFLAYLTIVPSMALALVVAETRFFESYVRYYRDIEEHATLEEIRQNEARVLSVLRRGFGWIALVQAVLSGLALLSAPALIAAVHGGLEMVSIYRFGVLGAYFQNLLILVLVALAYFDQRRLMVRAALIYLLLNAALTVLSLQLGIEYIGWGYLMATLISLVFALMGAVERLSRLTFMTFIANNPGLE